MQQTQISRIFHITNHIFQRIRSSSAIKSSNITRNMTTSTTRPKVLQLGEVFFAQKKWEELAKTAEVVECTSSNREEFFKDLKSKYSDITNIARTFQSIEQTGRFDAELASHLPESVKSISHCGAGYDQIDVDPFTEKGIQISNVTEPVEGPTALTAVFLCLSAMRNFQEGHDNLVRGEWPAKGKAGGAKLGHEPEGKTVGILGMGGIGRAIKERLLGFGFEKYIYHNRSKLSNELAAGSEYVSYDELLAQSDVLFISVPLNKNTHHLINADAFAKMKEGVVVINTARGPVIDEKQLYKELKSGKVGAFGSDVFEFEPEVPAELAQLPNVISLPHMGTHSSEAIRNLEEWVVENILAYISTGKVKTIVPEQAKVEFN